MSGFGFGMSEDAPPPPQLQRSHRAVGLAVVAAVLVVIIVVVVVVARYTKGLFGGAHDYSGSGTGSVLIVIKDGDSASTIGSTLAHADVVGSASAFTSAAASDPRAARIGPGTYRLRHHMQASQALDLLLLPSSRVSFRVLIPEGFTVKDIVKRIAKDTPIKAPALTAALNSPASIGLPSYAQGHVEGYLFPATYDVEPGETASQLLAAMVARFKQAATDVKLTAGASKVHLSPGEVVTLASIVQREGRLTPDFAKIAEVFFNRLHSNTRLDSDATLYYVLGPDHGPLTASDLALDSPYNTRLHTGLPPTAINSPGEAALQAVLHHPNGPYQFFVTIDRAGHTAFAKTLDEFNALVAQSRRNGVS